MNTPEIKVVNLPRKPRQRPQNALGATITPKPRYRLTMGGKRSKGLKSLSKLMHEADAIFSEYVRRKYADKDGMVKSFTGNEVKHWKQMHCGHYLSRSYKATRWDEDNARPQSMAENVWRHGNPIEFRIHLVEEIGEERVKALEAKRNIITRLNREFYTLLIAGLKEKLSALTNK